MNGYIEKENNIARIYIGEHQALDNTKIHLHRLSSKEIQISWVADAEDFNYYDERAKRNEIIVHAVYKYE